VVAAIGGDAVLRSLDEISDTSTKLSTSVKVREALLDRPREGWLALSRLLETARWLCQAEEGAFRPDWVRVAVFGYYAGTTLSRATVAGRLERSQSSVKKHISAIRAAFGVKGRGGRDTGRAVVRQRAVAKGWVVRT